MTMMNPMFAIRCKFANRKLSAYLDLAKGSGLSHAQIVRVQSHLAECQKCSSKIQAYKEIQQAFEEITLPDDGVTGSLERLNLRLKEIADPTQT